MKTLTEFFGFDLQSSVQKLQELTTEGKTLEEIQQAIGELKKIEGDRLKFLMHALDFAKARPEGLKRIIVFTAAEGEKIPNGAEKREEQFYLCEFFPSNEKGGRDRGRDRPGGDRDRKGKRGKGGKRDRGDREKRGDRPSRGGDRPQGPRPPKIILTPTAPGAPGTPPPAGAAPQERKPRPPRKARPPRNPLPEWPKDKPRPPPVVLTKNISAAPSPATSPTAEAPVQTEAPTPTASE